MDLLEILGDDYIADHCLNEYRRQEEEKVYRLYIADSLYCIMNYKAFGMRYNEIINGMSVDNNVSEISATEIKQNMLKKLNEGRKE